MESSRRIDLGQQEDRLVSVHDVLAFLSDFDGLPDPPCCPIRFPPDNYRLFPVDNVIFYVDIIMVCDCRLNLQSHCSAPTVIVSWCFWCISGLRVIPLPSGVPSRTQNCIRSLQCRLSGSCTWNPVNALSCAFFGYFVLRMNQNISDSRVGPRGRGGAMPFIHPSHSLRNPSTHRCFMVY